MKKLVHKASTKATVSQKLAASIEAAATPGTLKRNDGTALEPT